MISPDTFARYAAMRVPRYTSYPTAPNCSASVGEDDYRQWLRALPADEPVSLYLDLIEVVEEARPLVRTVAAAFDSYLPGSAANHAVAV